MKEKSGDQLYNVCYKMRDIINSFFLQLKQLMRAISNRSPNREYGRKFFPVTSLVFVFCCPDQVSDNWFICKMKEGRDSSVGKSSPMHE